MVGSLPPTTRVECPAPDGVVLGMLPPAATAPEADPVKDGGEE